MIVRLLQLSTTDPDLGVRIEGAYCLLTITSTQLKGEGDLSNIHCMHLIEAGGNTELISRYILKEEFKSKALGAAEACAWLQVVAVGVRDGE